MRWLLVAPFVTVVLIGTIGSLIGGIWFWGTSFWGILPRTVLFGAVGVYILTVGLLLSRILDRFGDMLTRCFSRIAGRSPAWLNWTVFASVVVALTYILRSQNLVYGDGFSVYGPMARPLKEVFTSLHETIRPLTVILYSAGSTILKDRFAMDDLQAVSSISVMGGVVGFLGLAVVVRQLSTDLWGRMAIYSIVVSGGSTLLFLGHIEAYVWSTAMMVWCLATTIRYIRGQSGLWLLLSVIVLTSLFNLLLLPASFAATVFAISNNRTGAFARFAGSVGRLSAVLTLCSLAAGMTLWLMDVPFAVPILASSYSAYSVFSLQHLADLANLLFFLSGTGLFAIATALIVNREKRFTDAERLLLVWASAGFLTIVWLDPSLGAVRDWDLLAIPGFPLALLGGSMISRLGKKLLFRPSLAGVTALTATFVLIPICCDNLHQKMSVERVEAITWEDMHYTEAYQKAGRCIPWGMNLYKDCARPDLAEKYFRRNVEADSLSHLGWYNLGVVAFGAERFVEAHNDFVQAVRLQPQSDTYRVALASTMRILGNFEGADRLLRRTSPGEKQ